MSVDPQLFATWAKGWALTRGAEAPVRDRDAWRIEVGQPDQLRRYVHAGMSEDVVLRAIEIDAPFVFLKVCADPDVVRARLSQAWDVRQTGVVMRLDRAMPGEVGEDSAFRTELRREGTVRFCVFRDAAGLEAARGRAVRVEDRVIYDRIAVAPDYRRRGLGARIMRTLQVEQDGWGLGALVATEEGARLYATLGWRAVSPYTTAVRL